MFEIPESNVVWLVDVIGIFVFGVFSLWNVTWLEHDPLTIPEMGVLY